MSEDETKKKNWLYKRIEKNEGEKKNLIRGI
jgi:hypothetical protein